MSVNMPRKRALIISARPVKARKTPPGSGAAPRSRRQAGVQRAQQHERIEGDPLRGHHVVVAQRGVHGPIAGKGIERAGDEGGEVGGEG